MMNNTLIYLLLCFYFSLKIKMTCLEVMEKHLKDTFLKEINFKICWIFKNSMKKSLRHTFRKKNINFRWVKIYTLRCYQ